MRQRPFEIDPVIEAYKKDVDASLLRENLKRSIDERLINLIAMQRWAHEMKRARLQAQQKP